MAKENKHRKPCFFTAREIKEIQKWADENTESEFSPAVRKLCMKALVAMEYVDKTRG